MSAPSVDADIGLRRITRRDLAASVVGWRAIAGMYGVVGAATVTLLIVGGMARPALVLAFLACVVAMAAVVLSGPPPAMHSRRHHAVLASTYLLTVLGLFAFQPYPEIGIALAISVGPLVGSRLDDARHVAGHLAAATAVLALAAVAGGLLGALNEATIVDVVLMVLAMWCLGISCQFTLEAAEAQGADLERLVRCDPLTGVGNRRMLVERLDDELSRHLADGRPLSVIALNLDGFQALNDALGRAGGDELLREVASALTSVVRPSDAVVRQGGNEFCLILVDTPVEEAAHVADAVRAALAAIEVDGRRLTGGIGAATCPADATTRAELLAVADRRLVDSKHGPSS